MFSTLLLLFAIWAVTVPVVLGFARLLGRVSAPRVEAAPAPEPREPLSDNVVPLVPRPRNELEARAA